MNRRPAWTLTEAVERTGASRSTIRRYREAGKLPNAYKDQSGAWRFPHEDLLAAGLKFVDPAQNEHVNKVSEHPVNKVSEQDDELVNKVKELEQALAVEKARNQGLERVAQLAQENAKDLRQALRMLEMNKSEPAQNEHVNKVSEHPLNKVNEQAVNTPENGRKGSFFRWLRKG